MTNPYFSIFTPVFNGGKHLNRVFDSIVSQTFKNFEWIIVNDGSTDNTATLIQDFIQNHPEVETVYIDQSNSGKHISWNRAVKMARGTLFVPADADDYFFPDTLKFFFEKWNEIPPDKRSDFSGINVLCLSNDSDEIVGNSFPVDGLISNNVELEIGYRLKGEKWGCIRTDILKTRHFPIVKGSHFPESYLWYHFSKKFKVICFNKPLRRYYTTETGITQSAAKNANGRSQHWVNMRYFMWLNFNFGFYLLRHSPESFFNNIRVILGSLRRLAVYRR